jgi:hypothetical protein
MEGLVPTPEDILIAAEELNELQTESIRSVPVDEFYQAGLQFHMHAKDTHTDKQEQSFLEACLRDGSDTAALKLGLFDRRFSERAKADANYDSNDPPLESSTSYWAGPHNEGEQNWTNESLAKEAWDLFRKASRNTPDIDGCKIQIAAAMEIFPETQRLVIAKMLQQCVDKLNSKWLGNLPKFSNKKIANLQKHLDRYKLDDLEDIENFVAACSPEDVATNFYHLGLERLPKSLQEQVQTKINQKLRPLLQTSGKGGLARLRSIMTRVDQNTPHIYEAITRDQSWQVDHTMTRQLCSCLDYHEHETARRASENLGVSHLMWNEMGKKNMKGQEALHLKRSKQDREWRCENALENIKKSKTAADLKKVARKINKDFHKSRSKCYKLRSWTEVLLTKEQKKEIDCAITQQSQELQAMQQALDWVNKMTSPETLHRSLEAIDKKARGGRVEPETHRTVIASILKRIEYLS